MYFPFSKFSYLQFQQIDDKKIVNKDTGALKEKGSVETLEYVDHTSFLIIQNFLL